jgi:superfamily I DNA/RNA helicase
LKARAIVAGPGTGKTQELLSIAIASAINGERVLLLTYMRAVAEKLKQRLVDYPTIEINTVHGFCFKLLNQGELPETDINFDQLLLDGLAYIQHNSQAKILSYDLILEDEAQDASHLQVAIVRELAKHSSGLVRAGDPNQNITSSFMDQDPDEFWDFSQQHQTILLPAPRRFDDAVAWRLNQFIHLTQQHPDPVVQKALKPIFYDVRLGAQEIRDVMEAQGGTHVLLVPYNQRLDRVKRLVSPYLPELEVMTYHKAKGLEWDHVWLYDLDKRHFPWVDEQQILISERLRLLFVGLSRARCQTHLLYHGDLNKIPEHIKFIATSLAN